MEPNFKIAPNKAQRTDDSHYHKVGTAKTHNHVYIIPLLDTKWLSWQISTFKVHCMSSNQMKNQYPKYLFQTMFLLVSGKTLEEKSATFIKDHEYSNIYL